MTHLLPEQYNEAFRSFLGTLNPAQQKAVAALEGPVLVIAGPGTGKTHILTARIGKILLDTDARAHNVLCLTFTEAGVAAMRRRLIERIGPEAHRVPIYTFHAFCNRVIQDNLSEFGKGDLEPVTELEQIELIRNLMVKLPPEHPLRAGNKQVFQYEAHLRDLFQNMKKEGWTPGWVQRKIDEFLRDLPQNPDFIYQKNSKHGKKGELKTALIDDVKDKMTRLHAAADLYPKYQSALERAGRYEYEDMLLWVIRAFEKKTALLRTYQERYQYILVDEYQDTNGAQNKLLQLLLDYWETPNIFIVGDDDQSIFEFQGARLENLRDFYQRYKAGLQTVVLEENYRSSQAILDAAERLIRNNELRAVAMFDERVEKHLRAARQENEAPEFHLYESRLEELSGTVGRIKVLLDHGVKPREIAVVYALHRQSLRLQNLLEKSGIPFDAKRPVNILDLPLIRQVRSMLAYMYEESQRSFSGELRLFQILHAGFFNLNLLDLARLQSGINAGIEDAGGRYAAGGETHRPASVAKRLREALCDPVYLSSLSLSEPEKLHTAGLLLESLLSDLPNLSPAAWIEKLFSRTGLLSWALAQPDKIRHTQVLYSFFGFVDAETRRNPRFSLARLLDLLDGMDDNRIALPLQKAVEEGEGVQLLTAHGAKGLEFEYVFMIDCCAEAWEKGQSGNRGKFSLPPNLTLSGEEDALEARRRLFYVAMTRAKKSLVVSCARTEEGGKPVETSIFTVETGLPAQTVFPPAGLLVTARELLVAEPSRPVILLPEAPFLDKLLERYSLSITGLNRYLRCPIAFYYEDLLRVPGRTSEAAAYGQAMHGALQTFFLKMKADKKAQWPDAESLIKAFHKEMERRRAYFSENAFVQRAALGVENLRRIHVEQIPFWRKRAVVERRIDRAEINGIPVNGVLDKIEWLDNGSIRIVDFKTGTPDAKKTAAPDEKQPNGGEYWRQLAFYRLLLEQSRIYPEPVSKTAVSWLAPDKRGVYPVVDISFSAEQLQFVTRLVLETWEGISARRFDTGCNAVDCPWCRLLRERDPFSETVRTEEVGLDDGE